MSKCEANGGWPFLLFFFKQIDKASRKTEILADNHHEDGGEDEEEEEDADEVLFGEESESEDSSGVDE